MAQSRLSTTTVSDLARIIYENKAELALTDGFASKIEPAATDKDAFIVAHPGAAEYINDEIKSFVERYSDLMYVALAALSIIGTIFAAIYTKVTRIAPEKASQLATAILDIGERMEYAKSARRSRRTPGRAGNGPARRGDRLARRHHLQRRTGYFQARL